MKERPILFSTPMVQAIRAGQKTQTRRIVKGAQPTGRDGFHVVPGGYRDERLVMHEVMVNSAVTEVLWSQACPQGRVGDRLWIRETFGLVPTVCGGEDVVYAADYRDGSDRAAGVRYRPSIHMPRWACCTTLDLAGIRLERLQSISRNDAMAEGIVRLPDGGYGLADGSHYHYEDPRESFFSLWESINGDGSVMANPWVWVYDFREVQP